MKSAILYLLIGVAPIMAAEMIPTHHGKVKINDPNGFERIALATSSPRVKLHHLSSAPMVMGQGEEQMPRATDMSRATDMPRTTDMQTGSYRIVEDKSTINAYVPYGK